MPGAGFGQSGWQARIQVVTVVGEQRQAVLDQTALRGALRVAGDCRAATSVEPVRPPSTVIRASLSRSAKVPSPCARASAAPNAIVAWPQNGTSIAGAK